MRDLTKVTRRRIRTRIEALGEDPYRNALKLRNLPGFRQRVGNYRVVYEIDDRTRVVHVTGVFHRREAYR